MLQFHPVSYKATSLNIRFNITTLFTGINENRLEWYILHLRQNRNIASSCFYVIAACFSVPDFTANCRKAVLSHTAYHLLQMTLTKSFRLELLINSTKLRQIDLYFKIKIFLHEIKESLSFLVYKCDLNFNLVIFTTNMFRRRLVTYYGMDRKSMHR